ncbi:MAG: hypothetical protein EU517_01490, partial [Promethearchaeota archaeon]
ATEGEVTVQYEPFRKIISHTLRFANESKEEKQQVFGICIGEYLKDEKRYIVKNAIPITHGDDIEIGWSEEMHNTIESIKSDYKDGNDTVIGWYHSHLGYGLYFSNADKANNLYFQNSDNLYGFGILIEQSKLKEAKDFGVDVYRIKDVSKGVDSDYVKVKFEIEPPNSMQFFKWVQELVESTQEKNAKLIYEVNELSKPTPEVLQEIPTSDKEHSKIKEERELTLLYGVNDGMDKLTESFIKTYEQQLTSWMEIISEDVLKGSEYIRSSINNIKITLSSGLEDAQRIFDRIFSEISSLFMKNVRASVDIRLENQVELKESIEADTEEQLHNLFNRLENEMRNVTNYFEEKFSNIKKDLERVVQKNKSILESLNQNNELLNAVYEASDKLAENVIQNIKNSSANFQTKLFNELEDFSNAMKPNEETFDELEEMIERLQKTISDLRQIK